MSLKVHTDIHWTVLELKGLLEDEDSSVYYERHIKHIGFHPSHLRNLALATREILNSKLNSYNPELKGLLLSYKNPTLVSQYGGILHDNVYIHMDIEADFYTFRPNIGTRLRGIVNKKGLNHIGVLVHKVFMVSIPQPEGEEDWPGDKVNIGQEIIFTVNQLDFSSKLPYIRGVLYEDEYLQGCAAFSEPYETDGFTDSKKNIILQEDLVADTSGISAKKRKRITFDSESEEEEKSSRQELEQKPAKILKTSRSQDYIINNIKKEII